MGSAFLYLGIVVMWLSVLLPMWLRRDKHDDVYEEPVISSESAEEPAADTDTIVEAPLKDRSKEEPGASDETFGTAVESFLASVETGGPPADRIAATAEADASAAGSQVAPPVSAPLRPRRKAGHHRARVLARRRRRLLWSILLVVASVVTTAVRVVPWWAVAPSGVLLVGYLLILRVAVRVDREQREKAARARAERLRRLRERREALAAMAREAEIIEFEARKRSIQVFDQYADGRRAVGD
jgi:hypothetical protein